MRIYAGFPIPCSSCNSDFPHWLQSSQLGSPHLCVCVRPVAWQALDLWGLTPNWSLLACDAVSVGEYFPATIFTAHQCPKVPGTTGLTIRHHICRLQQISASMCLPPPPIAYMDFWAQILVAGYYSVSHILATYSKESHASDTQCTSFPMQQNHPVNLPRHTCNFPVSTRRNSACHNSKQCQLQVWREDTKLWQ
jgi:hypothetical protein